MKRYYIVSLFLMFTLASCQKREPATNSDLSGIHQSVSPAPRPKTQIIGMSVSDTIKQIPFIESRERAGMLRAWSQVPGWDQYRMVEAPDLAIPNWVQSQSNWQDVEMAISRPYDYGELSGAYGLVLLLVDKTVTDHKRFNVLVLRRRPVNRYELHWIFRKEDLSRVTLHRHSGDAYLQEFREDGTRRACDIEWDRKQGKWACNLD